MKAKLLLVALLCSPFGWAVPFEDDFNGNSINSSLWEVVPTFGDSSVTQNGGVVTIRNGGQLLSNVEFTTPFEVSGRFRITGNVHDVFIFGLRTTGEHYPNSQEFLTGLTFRVHKLNDRGTDQDSVSFQRQDGGAYVLGDATVPFELNEFYDFKVQDFGDSVLVFFQDMNTPLFTASDSIHLGGRIGFYNREGIGGGSSVSDGSTVEIDFLRVRDLTTVPDLGQTSGLLILGLFGLVMIGRFKSL